MNNAINALKALVRKDITLFFSNRRSLIITIAAPILIAAFFGNLMSPKSTKLSKVPIAVVDLDRSPLSTKITTALAADTSLDVTTPPQAEATELVRNGKLRAMVVLPAGFGSNAPKALFSRGENKNLPQIDIHYDPSQSMVLGLVRGILSQHVMEAVSQSVFGGNGFNNLAIDDLRTEIAASSTRPELKRDLGAMFDSIAKVQTQMQDPTQTQTNSGDVSKSDAGKSGGGFSLSLPFKTEAIEVTSDLDKKYNGYAQSFAGMSVQFVLFMGIDFGIALLLARRMGLWKRFRAAPISRATLLGGSILSCTLIASFVMATVFAVAMAVFGVRVEGSMAGFLGLIVAFGFLTATFGLLIAAIGQTPEATRGLAILATLLMVMLGGAWIPSFLFPEWLQTVSLAVPTRWAIDGLAAMTWRGLGIEAALKPIAVMLGFSVLFGGVAIWRFDWEE